MKVLQILHAVFFLTNLLVVFAQRCACDLQCALVVLERLRMLALREVDTREATGSRAEILLAVAEGLPLDFVGFQVAHERLL